MPRWYKLYHVSSCPAHVAPRACVCKMHWSEFAADKQQKKQAWLIRDQCLGTLLSHSRGDTAEATQAVSAEERHSAEAHPCVWMGTGSPVPSRSLPPPPYVKQPQMAKLLQMMVSLKAIRRTAKSNSSCQCRVVQEPLVKFFETSWSSCRITCCCTQWVDSSVSCAEIQIVLYMSSSLYCTTCMALLQSRITLQFCRHVCTSCELMLTQESRGQLQYLVASRLSASASCPRSHKVQAIQRLRGHLVSDA